LFFGLAFYLHILIVFLVLFGFLDVKPDFTDAVLVSDLVIASLDDNVIFVNSGVVDVLVVDGEDGVVVGHAGKGEDG
jgi:hypothetical protein